MYRRKKEKIMPLKALGCVNQHIPPKHREHASRYESFDRIQTKKKNPQNKSSQKKKKESSNELRGLQGLQCLRHHAHRCVRVHV